MPAPGDRTTAPRPAPPIDLGGFRVLPENRSSVRAIQGVARAVTLGKRMPVCPLLLHGPPGCGKSHLASALVAAVTTGEATARIEPAGDLARPDSPTGDAGFGDRGLRTCDVFVLEDVQHLPERAADAVCDLIDRRAARRKALVITANTGPADLVHLPRRLTSRLAAGLVVQMTQLGPSSRRLLLEDAASAKKLRLTADALDYLAAQPGSLRALFGSLQNLALVAPNFPGPLDRAAVEQTLAGTGQPTSREREPDAIIRRAAAAFGVTPKELLGPSRLRNVLLARQVAMYLVREVCRLSLPRTGAVFGRDHTTVLHACRKVAAAIETDAGLNARVRGLRSS
jgi:chromosomal replication initiator protein